MGGGEMNVTEQEREAFRKGAEWMRREAMDACTAERDMRRANAKRTDDSAIMNIEVCVAAGASICRDVIAGLDVEVPE